MIFKKLTASPLGDSKSGGSKIGDSNIFLNDVSSEINSVPSWRVPAGNKQHSELDVLNQLISETPFGTSRENRNAESYQGRARIKIDQNWSLHQRFSAHCQFHWGIVEFIERGPKSIHSLNLTGRTSLRGQNTIQDKFGLQITRPPGCCHND